MPNDTNVIIRIITFIEDDALVKQLIWQNLILPFFNGENRCHKFLGVWIFGFTKVMNLFYHFAMLHDNDVVAEHIGQC